MTSLVDWEMRSDRNHLIGHKQASASLVDWEMRSDRNLRRCVAQTLGSLVDWEMRSDRNGSESKSEPHEDMDCHGAARLAMTEGWASGAWQ